MELTAVSEKTVISSVYIEAPSLLHSSGCWFEI